MSASDEFDVIVVGFGCAGACAAITAADAGKRVLVLDRDYGGGSTAQSGGVVYAGGGTRQQQDAGVEDSPENLFAYLKQEVGDAVSEATLRRFAETSPEMIRWLEEQGVPFEGSLCPYKTSYPTNRHYLYFSGNEQVPAYAAHAEPAPRGHRTKAKNFSGAPFFGALKRSALQKGVTFRPLAKVTELIVEDDRVVGVRFAGPPPGALPGRHERLTKLAAKALIYYRPLGKKLAKRAWGDVKKHTVQDEARARDGVILTTGGHAFNREVVEHFAPAWKQVGPLGTIGDNGAAMRLSAPLGAATGHLDKMSGWRFIAPPAAFMEGIWVDQAGTRFTNEMLYGATMSRPMVEEHDARAYLVLDQATWKRARRQLRTQAAFFHVPQLLYVFGRRGHKRAATLEGLAKALGVDADGLAATVERYNADIAAQREDAFGKRDDLRHPIEDGPFYGVDCSNRVSPAYPMLSISLGGLVVDEETGAVRREDGTTIDGLFAAGRSAVGICSNTYVSGLSLADAVFSGRRAGAHVAAAAAATSTS